jgi:glycine hydroxymethyltransferase
MRLNFSGKMYEAHAYGLNPDTFLIDMDIVRARAIEVQPKVLIAGWSAYSRHLDFAAFRAIADEVGAKLWVDMAHFAGLVAAGLHPNPVPFADVVSTTVHKTLAGPRSGLILCKAEYAKKIDSAVFPGQQGGPLMHVVAAKAVAFKAAMGTEFKDRQTRTIQGARIIADRLVQADVTANGVSVLTGGTDVHLVLVDLRDAPIDGQVAEDLLHEVGITVNRNSVPNDLWCSHRNPSFGNPWLWCHRVHRSCRHHCCRSYPKPRHRFIAGSSSCPNRSLSFVYRFRELVIA